MKSHINRIILDKLKLIQSEGEPEIVGELVKMLFESAPQKIRQIEDYVKVKNFKACRKEAHSLKSSAKALGAEKLAFICEQLEESAAKFTADHVRILIDSLKDEYAHVEQELGELTKKSS